MLETVRSADARFFVLTQRVDLRFPLTSVFTDEALAREFWRDAAIAATIGSPFEGHLIVSAKLYAGPTLGNKHDARRLAEAGHMRLLETSHPLAPVKERETA